MIRRLIYTVVVAAFILGLLYMFLIYSGRWDDFVSGISVWL